MTRLFRYILVTDSGMAPCIDKELVSLATCKPRIRAGAQRGDWVASFSSVSGKRERQAPPGRLVYLGRVAETLDVGEYERKHRCRSDAVYHQLENGSFHRKRPDYHPDARAQKKDLSAGVLIFDKSATWYFGDKPVLLPDEFQPCFARGIGHKINGVTEAEINSLVTWLRERWPPGHYGEPRHRSRPL